MGFFITVLTDGPLASFETIVVYVVTLLASKASNKLLEEGGRKGIVLEGQVGDRSWY